MTTQIQQIVRGLTLIEKYLPDAMLGGEHDVLYVQAPPGISGEDERTLESLGWAYESENESWRHFV